MGTLSIYPSYPQFKETNGSPLNDGKIYVGTAGLDPVENQISIYWDSALSIPASQPVSTINGYPSNSGSRGMLYMSGTDYSLTVLDKNNVEIYSSLNLTDINYAASSTVSGQVTTNTADIATNVTDIATNVTNISTNTTDIGTNTSKLATIETGADVTDSTNVNAAGATMNTDTSLTGNSYFLDEDDMSSDDATKVPSQQSVKAYVDNKSPGLDGTKGALNTISTSTGSPDTIAKITDKILQISVVSSGQDSMVINIDESDESYAYASSSAATTGTITGLDTSFGPVGSHTLYIRVVGSNYEIYNTSASNLRLCYIWL